mgnify:CR=1 FL=1
MKSLETVTDWILFIGGIIMVISFVMALVSTAAHLNLHGGWPS